MKNATVLLALIFLAASSSPSGAGLMAIWDFGASSAHYTENVTAENVIGVPTLAIFGGEKDTNGKNGIAYTDAAGVHHDAGQAGAWDDVRVSGPDAEWILTINTTGWTDISIRWDYRSEETPSFDLHYRVGGATVWSDVLADWPIIADDAWHSFSCDMSYLSAVEGQPIVEFRVEDMELAGNGRFIFDNLELTGVPEPCTIALLALGGIGLIRKRGA
jgi:hypothetical protein